MIQTHGGPGVGTRGATADNTLTYRDATQMPAVIATAASRRIALHHRLVRKRRWSREFDRLLDRPQCTVACGLGEERASGAAA